MRETNDTLTRSFRQHQEQSTRTVLELEEAQLFETQRFEQRIAAAQRMATQATAAQRVATEELETVQRDISRALKQLDQEKRMRVTAQEQVAQLSQELHEATAISTQWQEKALAAQGHAAEEQSAREEWQRREKAATAEFDKAKSEICALTRQLEEVTQSLGEEQTARQTAEDRVSELTELLAETQRERDAQREQGEATREARVAELSQQLADSQASWLKALAKSESEARAREEAARGAAEAMAQLASANVEAARLREELEQVTATMNEETQRGQSAQAAAAVAMKESELHSTESLEHRRALATLAERLLRLGDEVERGATSHRQETAVLRLAAGINSQCLDTALPCAQSAAGLLLGVLHKLERASLVWQERVSESMAVAVRRTQEAASLRDQVAASAAMMEGLASRSAELEGEQSAWREQEVAFSEARGRTGREVSRLASLVTSMETTAAEAVQELWVRSERAQARTVSALETAELARRGMEEAVERWNMLEDALWTAEEERDAAVLARTEAEDKAARLEAEAETLQSAMHETRALASAAVSGAEERAEAAVEAAMLRFEVQRGGQHTEWCSQMEGMLRVERAATEAARTRAADLDEQVCDLEAQLKVSTDRWMQLESKLLERSQAIATAEQLIGRVTELEEQLHAEKQRRKRAERLFAGIEVAPAHTSHESESQDTAVTQWAHPDSGHGSSFRAPLNLRRGHALSLSEAIQPQPEDRLRAEQAEFSEPQTSEPQTTSFPPPSQATLGLVANIETSGWDVPI